MLAILTTSPDVQVEEWLQFVDADGGSMTDAKLQKVAVKYAQALVVHLLLLSNLQTAALRMPLSNSCQLLSGE